MLFGVIYALNLSYPSELKYTFDALQKLLMEMEPKKMTRMSVQSECQALSIGFIKETLDTGCVLFCIIACIQIYSMIKGPVLNVNKRNRL